MENERLRKVLQEKFYPSNINENSKPMLEVYALVQKIQQQKQLNFYLVKEVHVRDF